MLKQKVTTKGPPNNDPNGLFLKLSQYPQLGQLAFFCALTVHSSFLNGRLSYHILLE